MTYFLSTKRGAGASMNDFVPWFSFPGSWSSGRRHLVRPFAPGLKRTRWQAWRRDESSAPRRCLSRLVHGEQLWRAALQIAFVSIGSFTPHPAPRCQVESFVRRVLHASSAGIAWELGQSEQRSRIWRKLKNNSLAEPSGPKSNAYFKILLVLFEPYLHTYLSAKI